MKIQNSSIVMASTHHEEAFAYKEKMTMQAAKSKDAVGAILTLSQEADGKSITVQDRFMRNRKKQNNSIYSAD